MPPLKGEVAEGRRGYPSVSLTASSSPCRGANKENLSVMASREIGHASSPCRGAKYV